MEEFPGIGTVLDGALGPYGVVAIVVLGSIAFMRGWWYAGSTVTNMIKDYESRLAEKNLAIAQERKDKEWYRDMMYRALGIAEQLEPSAIDPVLGPLRREEP